MASIQDLTELAEKQAAAEFALEQAILKLDQCKKELADVAEHSLPEAMEELGLTDFKTESGLRIKIIKKIRGNITNANRNNAMNWLRDNGHNAMIKRSITVMARDDSQGQELMEMLADFDVADKATIPWNTLDKFITEMLADGEDIPMDMFGVYRQLKTKVTK